MKNLLFTLCAVIATFGFVNAQDEAPVEGPLSDTGAYMVFDEEIVDYGTIEQNSDPLRTFTFTNRGSEPLIIQAAKGSCGCTVPKYSKEPIMPGESSEIEVRYDTKRIGNFSKTVTLTTNAVNKTGGKFVLRIKGVVEQPQIKEDPKTILPE